MQAVPMDLMVHHMYPWFMRLSIVTLPQIRLQAKVPPIHSTAVDALLDCGRLCWCFSCQLLVKMTVFLCVQVCSSYCFLVLLHQYGCLSSHFYFLWGLLFAPFPSLSVSLPSGVFVRRLSPISEVLDQYSWGIVLFCHMRLDGCTRLPYSLEPFFPDI